MSQPFIVLGDSTSHGGRVITADQTFTIYRKPVARVGDMVTCPRCKGTFQIANGAPDMVTLERAPARQGDKTTCGATLISSQSLATWSDESSMGGTAQASTVAQTAASAIAAATDSGICLECLAKAAASGVSSIVRGVA